MATGQFVFDPDYATQILADRGFDVSRTPSNLSARRESNGGTVVAVTLEPRGRLRLTRTFQPQPATTGVARFGRRGYQIIRDQSTTIVVVTDLDDLRHLGAALYEMESLAQQ